MLPKRRRIAEDLSGLLSDIEDLDLDDYSNESDLELETEHSSDDSDGDDQAMSVMANVSPAAAPPSQPGRRRRDGAILQTQNLNVPPGWGTNTSVFFNQQFTPNHAPGPKDIPSNVNAESSVLDFFPCFGMIISGIF